MDNPNNCEECEHFKSQRVIEADDPREEPLHCYMFKAAPTEVCHQHSARRMLAFDLLMAVAKYSRPTP